MDQISTGNIFSVLFAGLNLAVTLKIAFSLGEYKRQVDINTGDIKDLKKAPA
ncbi:hypothetical protein ABMA75_03140 [Halobacteriovorax sp. ZH4_bin.1]|uniref:hypothetical protein n=1 Tax=unclassified Halobacteriovorax TaxID=2639665 RepID=UPI00371261C1